MSDANDPLPEPPLGERVEGPAGPQETVAPGAPGAGGPVPSGGAVPPGGIGHPPAADAEPGTAESDRGPDETDAGAAQTVPATAPIEPGPAQESETDLVAELATARSAVAALTDDLKRLQAEYVNYKRRVDRDRELVRQNAVFAVLVGLLPVLDDLDRAREHGELEGGFKAVADSLERIVAAHGLEKFGEPGDEFDPRLHEALMHALSPDVTTTTCQNVVAAGYRIGDRVVRPARVTVVDPQPQDTTE